MLHRPLTSSIHLTFVTVLLTLSMPAHAYIGAGLGGGVVAAVVGIVVSIFLALVGIVYFPIKRAIRARRERRQGVEGAQTVEGVESVEAAAEGDGTPAEAESVDQRS